MRVGHEDALAHAIDMMQEASGYEDWWITSYFEIPSTKPEGT